MATKKAPWFGRVLKWHKMPDGHACAYRGRVFTIVKPEGAKHWHFTVDPDDPTAPRSHWCGGPGLSGSLERSRPLAEAMLLVDPADRLPSAPNFMYAVQGAPLILGDAQDLVSWTDSDQGLLRVCRRATASPGELPGPLVATVQPVFHRGGQILHWRIGGPDGTHWVNTAYWREACRLVESRA
ncbi:hypothetical protein D7D52_36055 [Nocardia yunnanensis]|uniref:Uncharacterized protein n=1 Tax=Nocardia yunnanensis TaxID=2382165 RepID=A0A386ZMF4_9NOCA|nr:hypothetical protein [Nocardia yunnanensis]AYF78354.1 hypothetical protein D7D52_36055 [Nocardia yunnanensis]